MNDSIKKQQNFDAVRFMRKVRDQLSRKYAKNPESLDRDLISIRKEIGISTGSGTTDHTIEL